MPRELRVIIAGDSASLERALSRASASAQGFGGSLGRAGASIASVGASMNRKLTVPIIAAAGASVKFGADFETSMSKIRGLVGASGQQISTWSKEILRLGPEVGRSPKELADALFFVASAGFKGENAMNVLRISAKASAAGLGETKTVADAVTSALNAYHGSGLTASKVTDTLVAAVKSGKMPVEDLAGAIGQVLPVASELGVGFDEVAGTAAALSRSGADVHRTMTGIRFALTALANPSSKAAKILKDVGISADDLRASIRDRGLLATFEELKQKLPIQEFLQVVGGARGVAIGLGLVGRNAAQVQQVMEAVRNSTGATNQAFGEAATTLNYKLKSAWASIQVALIQVGGTLAPTVARIAQQVARLAGAFTQLSPGARQFILIGLGIVAALGPVLSVIGNVARALGILRAAMVLAATTPLGAALLAVGILAGGLAARFVSGRLAAANFAAGLRQVRMEGDLLKTTLDNLDSAHLALNEAQHNVATTLHIAQAAQANYNTFAAKGTQETLAGKTAHDQAVSAWDAHARAVMTLHQAETAQTAAQQKANQETRNALGPVLELGQSLSKTAGWTGLLGSKFPGLTAAVNKLTLGIIGNTGSTTVSTEKARAWGIAVERAGMQSFRAAMGAEKMTPAGRAAGEAMGMMTEAAGRFARESGHVPTSIGQIVAKAKELHPGIFEGVMQAWIASAKKSGVEIPKWIQQAATQSKAHAMTLAAGVKQPLGTLPAAGTAAGRGLSAGLASGINGSAAIAKARAVVAAIKAIMSTRFGSTPEQWGRYAVGEPLIRGIAAGILAMQGAVTDAAEKSKNQIKATLQAKEIVALARQYGQQIGYEHAISIVRGLVQGTPSIVQQARQALQQATAEMRQKTIDGATQVGDAFGQLADRALQAFDAKVAAWKNPLAAKLANMQNADAIQQARDSLATAMAQILGGGDLLNTVNLEDSLGSSLGAALDGAMAKGAAAIGGAKTQAALTAAAAKANADITAAITAASAEATATAQKAVDDAKAAYTTAQANLTSANAALTAAQAGGGDEAIKQAQDAVNAAQTAFGNASTALQTAVGNQKAIEQAIRSEVEQATSQLSALIDKRHATIAAADRRGLASQLAQLGRELAKNPLEWAKMGVAVQKILTDYNVKLTASGKAWGQAFAKGIRDAKGDVEAAWREVMSAVNSLTPHSPAKEGPLSYDVAKSGLAWADRFAFGLKSGGFPISGVPTTASSGGGFSGVRPGGGNVYNVNVQVDAQTADPDGLAKQIVRPLVREIEKYARGNSLPGLGY